MYPEKEIGSICTHRMCHRVSYYLEGTCYRHQAHIIQRKRERQRQRRLAKIERNLKEKQPHMKDGSYKRYLSGYRRMMEACPGISLRHHKKVCSYLNTLPLSTRQTDARCFRNMAKNCMGCPQSVIDVYTTYFKQVSDLHAATSDERVELTESEKKCIPWSAVQERVDELYENRDSSRKAYLMWWVSYIQTSIPVLRSKELYSTRIGVQETGNYYDPENNKLVIRNHKTQRSYKTKEIQCPPEWVEGVAGLESMWLVPQVRNKDKHMSTGAFTRFLQRALGVACVNLRKIYTAEVLGEMPLVERQKVAKIMGHSLRTNCGIYGKLKEHLCRN